MARRAAEAIVKIEMAEGGLNVVAPKQAHDSAAQPDTLRIAGRTREHALGFGIFVELVELILARRGGLVGWFAIGALGER
jgi:hypothetical protein